jgi:hypothetical protein
VSDYIIRVRRSRKKLKQRYYVTIQAGNGEPLFHSEQLTNRGYALELGTKIAGALDATRVDET